MVSEVQSMVTLGLWRCYCTLWQGSMWQRWSVNITVARKQWLGLGVQTFLQGQ